MMEQTKGCWLKSSWQVVQDRMPLWVASRFYSIRYRVMSCISKRMRSRRTWYEVNVSINGWHLFATDSRIRHYSPVSVAAMIVEFRRAWPDAKVSVTAWNGRIDPLIAGALNGGIDPKRLDKAIGRFRKAISGMRSNDYVGGASADEAEGVEL